MRNINDISDKLKDWVKEARRHSGLSLEALGDAIGRTKQTVWSMENGKIEPSYTQLIKISDCTGYVEPFPGMQEKHPNWELKQDTVVYPIDDSIVDGYLRLDYLDIQSSSGLGRTAEDMPIIQKLDVLEDWVMSNLGRNAEKRIKIINNVGDSMAPTIQEGDILFVDISVTAFEAEGIYIINFNGALLTKRLIAQADGRLAIVSDNRTAYEPQYISARDAADLNICGRVKAWWSLKKY